MSQFSLFGAAAAQPSPADLDGVVLAGGRWVRGADGARLSVVVGHRWRADALAGEFDERALGAEVAASAVEPGATDDDAAVSGRWSVRTSFRPDLTDQAARWMRGAHEGPPADFALTAGGLRLWALAAAMRDEAGYLLGTRRADDTLHRAAGAQLSRLGLAAVSIGARGGPGWRVTSARRIRRLAELLGPAPAGAGQDWPGGA